jgi:hypothetical protein
VLQEECGAVPPDIESKLSVGRNDQDFCHTIGSS